MGRIGVVPPSLTRWIWNGPGSRWQLHGDQVVASLEDRGALGDKAFPCATARWRPIVTRRQLDR